MAEKSVFLHRFDYEDRTMLTDAAYGELKSAIIDQRFRPGDLLRESAIGRDLGISKTPVREALLKLEQDGLVRLVPFRGAQVSGYDADDVREIFELRAILQSECARHAAIEADEGVIAALRANVADSRVAHQADDLDAVVRLFDDFDDVLMSRLHNRRLQSIIANLQDHMKRIGKRTSEIPGRVYISIEQHEAIVDALASGDADLAQKAMRAHIESVLEDELKAMRKAELSGSETASPGEEPVAAS